MRTSHLKRKKISCTFPTFSYFSFIFLLFAVSIHNFTLFSFPLHLAAAYISLGGKELIRDGEVCTRWLLQDRKRCDGHSAHGHHHHVLLLPAGPCPAPHQPRFCGHGALDPVQEQRQHHYHRWLTQIIIIITGGYKRLKEIIIITCRRKPGSSQVVIGDRLYHRRLSKVIIIIIIGLYRRLL